MATIEPGSVVRRKVKTPPQKGREHDLEKAAMELCDALGDQLEDGLPLSTAIVAARRALEALIYAPYIAAENRPRGTVEKIEKRGEGSFWHYTTALVRWPGGVARWINVESLEAIEDGE